LSNLWKLQVSVNGSKVSGSHHSQFWRASGAHRNRRRRQTSSSRASFALGGRPRDRSVNRERCRRP